MEDFWNVTTWNWSQRSTKGNTQSVRKMSGSKYLDLSSDRGMTLLRQLGFGFPGTQVLYLGDQLHSKKCKKSQILHIPPFTF